MGGTERRQSVRQAARNAVLAAQAEQRAERVAREKRLSGWGVDVAVAIAERDAAIERHEQAAGTALRHMIEQEGMTPAEAARWCGEQVTAREAQRLMQRVADTGDQPGPAGDERTPA